MQAIVKIKNLCKKYNKRYILKDINLEVEKGIISGILGQNGSGKSTLMKILSGIEKPDSGEVLINGIKPGTSTKSQVAFLTENNQLYDWMSVNDAINFHQDFFQDFDVKKCDELMDFMDLTENYRLKKMSKGMLQRLRLSLTLARNSSVYLLDEPFMGIDTITRDKIIKAINSYYCDDSCVIITTHLISEVERILDKVSFISEGSIALSGDCEDLRFEQNQSIEDMYRKLYT
ncbi:MAG TPA: ABC transporter ATP-binding protein [Pseudobacteroides sp.]|uniref:ABC transporter ATP-binding protein n=1 Tax=Pseudobacteroides sp. TaxID=1968840 RepID=UPI002F9476CA